MNEYIIKGRDRIAKAVGKAFKDVPTLVEREGLPAYQERDGGPWFARPDDLDIWSIWKADQYLPEKWGEIRSQYQHLVSPSNKGNVSG
ncbi:hypothetical protein [Pseudodesulfovibrio sediminis]|uniref:Phage protein n=1 Tax=Pseudodesulfovibrio sediminis TaxID=2810563 RepID=A0ABM7P3G6_9BACT|nr:hypothetical protein [Pseudodesulfovibrio sediminis]BCS87345.1 hypothetical protein PSDVSF_05870 [Pseudodesulfovibrio sediminis]